MEKINIGNIERYIELNNELAIEDPYVLKIIKDEYLKDNSKNIELEYTNIFILHCSGEDIGFLEITNEADMAMIETIYIKSQHRSCSAYKNMLKFIEEYYYNTNIKRIMFIGLNDNADLMEALKDTGFIMEKEHIQMEKYIGDLSRENIKINSRTFYEIANEKWLYNFMEGCMEEGIFSYKEEEVDELTHLDSDLVFVLYEGNNPIGYIVSYINEKRNKQENKNVIYIEEIAILKEFRNKGYGYKLIKFVLDKGRHYGMEIGRLHVYRHNVKAHRLYKKLGFNEIKSIGHWVKAL